MTHRDSLVGKSEEVFERLRTDIVEGRILPGARLFEQDVADSLAVSRTPVREAFVRLVQAGLLVQGGTSRGHRVTTPTSNDVLEAYALREVLEGFAAGLAARRCDTADAVVLREIRAQLDAALEQGDLDLAVALTRKLHSKIWEMSGNQLLVTVMQDLISVWVRLNPTTYNEETRRGESSAEHGALIEALIANDPQQAESIARQHIIHARDTRLRMSVNPRSLEITGSAD